VRPRAPSQVQQVVAPEKRAQGLHIPHRGDIANELVVAGREIVLPVLAVEQPARVLVDHPLVPVEHQLKAINERARTLLARHECASVLQPSRYTGTRPQVRRRFVVSLAGPNQAAAPGPCWAPGPRVCGVSWWQLDSDL